MGPAPREVVDHLRRVSLASDEPFAPEATGASSDFVEDVRRAIDTLPVSIQALTGSLLGLFFVRGLGCSAVTDVVMHRKVVLGTIIVIDVENMRDKTANEWATWKERLPFSRTEEQELRVTLESALQNHRSNAVQFLLLHEIGHAVTARGGFLPDWWIDPKDLNETTDYAFLAQSWLIDHGHRICRRQPCVGPKPEFYLGLEIESAEIRRTYAELQGSDFPTLYSTGNPYDDFAECFAVFVHTVIMERPYKVELIEAGTADLLADEHMIRKRCAEKFSLIENMLSTG
jgi:hypothetical protein